ncbi:hypothetical protein Bbelb_287000 [Branchiostoma belcheri]|nr:hypothetical protein Bbelb_287000 [Branchiostoma belcheri]
MCSQIEGEFCRQQAWQKHQEVQNPHLGVLARPVGVSGDIKAASSLRWQLLFMGKSTNRVDCRVGRNVRRSVFIVPRQLYRKKQQPCRDGLFTPVCRANVPSITAPFTKCYRVLAKMTPRKGD